MKPLERHYAAAYLWLFAAGVDPTDQDANGDKLSESLAKVFIQHEVQGRREAAALYVSAAVSGEHRIGRSAEDTGSYNVGELEQLLRASGE